MDNIGPTALLFAQEKPDLFRTLAPLLVLVGIFVFRWFNEKIKKKEREQQAEQEDDYRREDQEAMARRSGSAQPPSRPVQQPQRPRPAEQIHRYQPQIPSPPDAPRDWRQPQAQESEQIVVAQDITGAGARLLRQQQLLRAQAHQRAKATQAQRRQRATELKARQAAQKAAARRKTSRALHDGDVSTAQTVLAPSGTLPSLNITVSHAQLRQAVVWAEILGPPRALRTYSFAY